MQGYQYHDSKIDRLSYIFSQAHDYLSLSVFTFMFCKNLQDKCNDTTKKR